MTNDDKDLKQQLIELAWEIEKLPASEQQTKVITMLTDIRSKATPQQPSDPLKELDEDELFAIISKHNTNNPDRFYNPKEMTNDRQLAIDICERFGQPSEKKALSVDSIKALLTTIMKKELVDIGEHFCFVCGEPMSEEKRGLLINHIAQAIHSALPARKEVKWPEKMEHGCDPNGYCDCSASDANEMRDACIAAYEEAIPAQREVRYPEKMEEERFYCEDGDIYRGREWNQAIDEFKKLNS